MNIATDASKPRIVWLPILALIAINLVPVYGVYYWSWSIGMLLLLYWLETPIVGFFTILKMIIGPGEPRVKTRAIGFFIIHYGLFWLFHGLFLLIFVMPIVAGQTLTVQEPEVTSNVSIKLVLAGLIVSHFISFMLNFMRRDPAIQIPPGVQMFAPYGRVFVIHILIVGSAFLADEFGPSSAHILALMVGLKIIADIVSHTLSNRIYQSGKNGNVPVTN